MAKKYTAPEMREASLWFYYQQNSTGKAKCFDRIEISAMLRQAADELEREEKREKKYEYTGKYSNGTVSLLHYEFIDPLKSFVDEHHRLVRREVGEWEEVEL